MSTELFQQPKAPDGMDHCMGCAHRLGTGCGCPCCTLPPPPAPPGAVELDQTVAAWVEAARAATGQITYYTEIRDRAYEQIQAAMGDATEARINGRPAVSWKPSKPSLRLDRKALEADLGTDLVARYLRPSAPARPFKLLAVDDQ